MRWLTSHSPKRRSAGWLYLTLATFAVLLACAPLGRPSIQPPLPPSVVAITCNTLPTHPGNLAHGFTDLVYVMDLDGTLWEDYGSWGAVPPCRIQVAAAVDKFQVVDKADAYVLDRSANLSLMQNWEQRYLQHGLPPQKQPIDANVKAFQDCPGSCLTGGNAVYVLGTDGKLWLEYPPYGPPNRYLVDANVESFYAFSDDEVLVLNNAYALFFDTGPWSVDQVAKDRQKVDADVDTFEAIPGDYYDVLVLGTNRRLWEEYGPWGPVPPPRDPVDSNVSRVFQGLASNDLYVRLQDETLWHDHGARGAPYTYGEVDANALGVQGIDDQTAYVLGSDLKLWLEQGPFPPKTIPPPRQLVDTRVVKFQALIGAEYSPYPAFY